MICRPLTPEEGERWDAFVGAMPSSGFMQSFFWGAFKKRTGWDVLPLGVFDDEKLIGGAIVLRFHVSSDQHFLYIPQGPVLDYGRPDASMIFSVIIEYIRNNLASNDAAGSGVVTSHLRIEPRITESPSYFSLFRRASFDVQPSSTILIGLKKSENDLLATMKPKGRYNIGVAQRHGVTVSFEAFDEKNLGAFYELYLETAKHHTFKPQSLEYFSSMMSPESSSYYTFAFARYESRIVSAALVVITGSSATYFYGASSSDVPEIMAPYLLQWETMRHAKNLGCTVYDLWGVVSATARANHPWLGFSKFKEKFGGALVRFIGAHDLILNESAYEEYLKKSGEKRV